VARKSQLENLVITDKFDDRKGPDRPRTSYLASLRKWLDPTANKNTNIQASAKRDGDSARLHTPGPGMAPDDDDKLY